VLFAPGTSRDRRRRRLAFAAVYAALAAAVTWPLFPWAAAAFPPLLGLPPSFAWVVTVLLAAFVAVALLYRADLADEAAPSGPGPGSRSSTSPDRVGRGLEG
jgi:hypothetical protein